MDPMHGVQSPYSRHLGFEVVSSAPERAVTRMTFTPELTNRNGVLHGGALMSLVDQASGTLAFEHCPEGMTNVTIEAKTNFLRAVQVGDVVTATAEPLHVGRTLLLVQVVTTRGDGKQVSVTTQTHQFLSWRG